jgi:GTPase SAR1 family protein
VPIPTKVALIGHSGSGKTTFVARYFSDDLPLQESAEMDEGLPFLNEPPPASAMLDWILASPLPVIVVSVHRQSLEDMVWLKRKADPRFGKICFVYLITPKTELLARLESREKWDFGASQRDHEEMDRIFRGLEDLRVETATLGKYAVQSRVAQIIKSFAV